MTQAIWQTELEKQQIASHWVPSVEEVETLVMFRDKARIVLLEPVDSTLVKKLCESFPENNWITVVKQSGLPDSVLCYEMDAPYTDVKINRLMSRLKTS